MGKKIVLSDRLTAVASLVTAGNRVCDVGCDHGFVPIYLVQQSISQRVLAMDVKEGPLEQAKAHIKEYGLETYIETRLSDGLTAYRGGEADSLICAGMGGRLMIHILEEDLEKTDSFHELILQPQSELQQFRRYLRRQGYLIVEENMIEEDGKFYPMMKAVKAEGKSLPYGDSIEENWRQQMEDKYGPVLLQKKHPVLYRYLEREKRICEEVQEQLRLKGLEEPKRGKRYREVEEQRKDCLQLLAEYEMTNSKRHN